VVSQESALPPCAEKERAAPGNAIGYTSGIADACLSGDGVDDMSAIGNILWILLGGGIFLFFEYLLGGLILCITIIGIPFGVQCIKLSLLALVPFGKEVVHTKSGAGCLSLFMNILWILTGGITIALTHVVFGILCAITIVGIPFAKQHMKLAALSLTPFGHTFR
jgi:uncharacterized membrane protein YccF (DUF307 family)